MGELGILSINGVMQFLSVESGDSSLSRAARTNSKSPDSAASTMSTVLMDKITPEGSLHSHIIHYCVEDCGHIKRPSLLNDDCSCFFFAEGLFTVASKKHAQVKTREYMCIKTPHKNVLNTHGRCPCFGLGVGNLVALLATPRSFGGKEGALHTSDG